MEICLPQLDGTTLTTSTTVKSLGVILDASLSMETQIAKVARQAFYHLRQVKQLAPYLSQDDLATVIHATVSSRLDYCNSLYAGLPSTLTWKLQLVQNRDVRFGSESPKFTRISIDSGKFRPFPSRIGFTPLVRMAESRIRRFGSQPTVKL